MYNIKKGENNIIFALRITYYIYARKKFVFIFVFIICSSSLSALSSLQIFVLCDLWMYNVNVKTSAHALCVQNYILHCFQGHFFADVNSNTHVDIDLLFSFLGWEKKPEWSYLGIIHHWMQSNSSQKSITCKQVF